MALRPRRFVFAKKENVYFFGDGLKKPTYMTIDSGRNVCDPKIGEAG
jgi:hypothetical protein